MTEHAANERNVIIIDEYPYLTESTRGLSSILQRWCERTAQSTRVMLVLCGSEQAMAIMDELDRGAAPLHQRFTLKLRLEALAYDEAAELLPRLDTVDCVRVYAILSETPLYVREWDTAATLRANLLRLFGDSRSSLVDAIRLTRQTDIGDATAAYQTLSEGMTLLQAYYGVLLFNGRVVFFTAVTLAIGVASWAFSPVKFQATWGSYSLSCFW